MLMHPLIIICFILIGIALVLNVWSASSAKENVEENWRTKVSGVLIWIGLVIIVLYFILDFFEVLY